MARWNNKNTGMSLIELLITLVISGLLASVGTQAMTSLIHRHQASTEIQALQMAIYLTRSQALITQSTTTLCPLINGSCQRQWNARVTAFIDYNKNRRLDVNEQVLTTVPAIDPERVLRQYPKKAFQFNNRGFAGFNNGSFSYCSTLGETVKIGASFIVSRMGRIRMGTDSDDDGLPETANGKNVPCPSR